MHQFVVVLKRDARDLPWGLRLVGGSDIDTPLIITRVYMTVMVVLFHVDFNRSSDDYC